MDLALGLVGAVLQHLLGSALDDVFVLQILIGLPDDRKDTTRKQKFLAEPVVGLDAVAAVFQELAGRKLGKVSAGVALVDIQDILDFVDGKFGLVQEHQDFQAHLVGNGVEQLDGGRNGLAGNVLARHTSNIIF